MSLRQMIKYLLIEGGVNIPTILFVAVNQSGMITHRAKQPITEPKSKP